MPAFSYITSKEIESKVSKNPVEIDLIKISKEIKRLYCKLFFSGSNYPSTFNQKLTEITDKEGKFIKYEFTSMIDNEFVDRLKKESQDLDSKALELQKMIGEFNSKCVNGYERHKLDLYTENNNNFIKKLLFKQFFITID
jgi:hypothetical protein